MTEPDQKKRCPWIGDNIDSLYLPYHDTEWGVPVHDDKLLFEAILLEGAQAGLSWMTILRRRDNYRNAFEGYDIEKIARYTEDDENRLMADAGIIRNRQKIRSAINNARRTLEVQEKHNSLDTFLWQFVGGQPLVNTWTSGKQIPVTTRESDAMSKGLKKAGFTFIGPTTCYALMQSVGMVNDHTVDCYRYHEINQLGS